MDAKLAGSITAASLTGAAALAYAVRGRSSSLLAPSVWRGPAGRKAIALTFDDGPSESTPDLLEILDKHQARATFFQCGVNAQRLPTVVRQVAAAGHEIGNHTNTHAALYGRSAEFIASELSCAQDVIAAASGSRPRLFRAPYGARWFGLRSAQQRLGLLGVMWSAIGLDWKRPAGFVVTRLLRDVRNGAIWCLHDGRELRVRPDVGDTLTAVRSLLPILLDRGFTFQTVSDLLCPAI